MFEQNKAQTLNDDHDDVFREFPFFFSSWLRYTHQQQVIIQKAGITGMAQRTILLLEQNQKIAYTMEAAATRSGYRFLGLPWGEDIIQYLDAHHIDVLLMNIKQTGISPRALILKIREDIRYRTFPLIIIYGKPGKESKSDYLKLGADDFVPMPFTPAEIMTIVDARVRPLGYALSLETRTHDTSGKQSIADKFKPQPVPTKGDLESIPLCSILARIHAYRDSGILHLILKKETRSFYFETGMFVFAESTSRRDDLGDFMARNGAGSGSGRELIAARNQAGGPGCDPREFRLMLAEVNLMDPKVFSWWANLYSIDLLTSLFSASLGPFQWQSLPLPDHAKEFSLPLTPLPKIIFEGIRSMPKWWYLRELLPQEESMPLLESDFESAAHDFHITAREMLALSVITGQRSLRAIREICHLCFPCIDNYIFALHQLSMLGFDQKDRSSRTESVDLHAQLNEDQDDSPLDSDKTEDSKSTTDPEEPINLTQPEPPVQIPKEKPITPPPSISEPAKPMNSFSLNQGDIAEIPATELFRECLDHEVSGSLEMSNLGITKFVFWKRGKILTVTSDDIDERLDNFLFRKHMLTAEQRDDLRTAPPDQIGSPNELLRRKYLSLEQVFSVVKEHAETLIDDILTWNSGTFRFLYDKNPPRDMVPLDLTPAALVMTGLRKLDKWDHIERFLPLDSDVMRLPERGGPRSSGLNLSHFELRILNVLTDPLAVSEILRRVGLDPMQIRQSLYAMECAGLVSRIGRVN